MRIVPEYDKDRDLERAPERRNTATFIGGVLAVSDDWLYLAVAHDNGAEVRGHRVDIVPVYLARMAEWERDALGYTESGTPITVTAWWADGRLFVADILA